ncbi:MAG: hypothetical protein AMXMBFR36_07080 [Acidobacteriota bacterium]
MKSLHLFFELFTLAAFAATAFWAYQRWRRHGAILVGALFALGGVRENFVILERHLYGFADLSLMLGAAPLISAIVWSYSILVAVAVAEAILGRPFAPDRLPRAAELAWVAATMIALAGFYEPLLARTGMARWEAGTVTWLEVPAIALVGYPTLAVASLALVGAILRRWRSTGQRVAVLALAIPALALAHAAGLVALKRALGW